METIQVKTMSLPHFTIINYIFLFFLHTFLTDAIFILSSAVDGEIGDWTLDAAICWILGTAELVPTPIADLLQPTAS